MFPLIREIYQEVCPYPDKNQAIPIEKREARLQFVHSIINSLSKHAKVASFNGDIGCRLGYGRMFGIQANSDALIDEEITVDLALLIDPSDFPKTENQKPLNLEDLQNLLLLSDEELKIYLGKAYQMIQNKLFPEKHRLSSSESEEIDNMDLLIFRGFLKFIQNKEKAKKAIKFLILHELGHIHYKDGFKMVRNNFMIFIAVLLAMGLIPYMITFPTTHASFVKRITALLVVAFIEYSTLPLWGPKLIGLRDSIIQSKWVFFAHWAAVGSFLYLISRNPVDLALAKKISGIFFSIYFLYQAIKKLVYPILFSQPKEYRADLFAARTKALIEGGIYLFSKGKERNECIDKLAGSTSLSFWEYLDFHLFYKENGGHRFSFLRSHPLLSDRIKALNTILGN